MVDLLKANAKICYTAAGQTFHENRILLVLHKKLNIWLVPGGHIDIGELPHIAAEREVFEETGLQVRAFDLKPLLESGNSQYIPSPIVSNVHWVCEENYRRRLRDGDSYQRDPQWQKGCEQHLGLVYLTQLVTANSIPKLDERESTDIGWFTEEEIPALHTTDDLKREFYYGFRLISTMPRELIQD